MNNKTGKKIKQQTREEFYENDKRKQPKRSELERVGCDDVKWKLSPCSSLSGTHTAKQSIPLPKIPSS